MVLGHRILALGGILFLVTSQAVRAEEPVTAEPPQTLDKNGSPATPGWIDRIQNVVQQRVHGSAESVDRFIAGGVEDLAVSKHRSKADIRVDMLLDDGLDANLDLDITVDLEFPRTERKLGLLLTTSDPDELPGDRPEDTDNSLYAGVRRSFSRKRIPHADVSFSVKVKTSPVALGQLRFGREFNLKGLNLFPFQKGYWLSDDGFGEVTGLSAIYWLKPKIISRSLSAIRWTEVSEGVEWQQGFLLGYTTRKGGYKGLDRGIGVRGDIPGHKTGSATVDSYRLSLIARKSLSRPWFFIRVGPEVEWTDEDNWEPNYSFRIGFDTLFWAAQDLKESS
jgi:hypothetical protein